MYACGINFVTGKHDGAKLSTIISMHPKSLQTLYCIAEEFCGTKISFSHLCVKFSPMQ